MRRRKPRPAHTAPRNHALPPSIGHNRPPDVRLAIVGSRTFSNPRLMAEALAEYVETAVLAISGGADGADRLGMRWARNNGIETLVFHPDHKRFRHAYHHRNRLIAEACTLLVAFWDGRSTGTKYTIEYARRIGREVRVVRF